MKVLFVAILFVIPIYIWYRLVKRVDRILFDGTLNSFVLYLILIAGWVGISLGLFFLLSEAL
ncbi:MAG: hypothetical protein CM15mP58_16230 [Burkholderiaceae bacterium]|nr:MAG: hypothetical protein CM15mP58_16230 [Burkholderiaceae bacterium]